MIFSGSISWPARKTRVRCLSSEGSGTACISAWIGLTRYGGVLPLPASRPSRRKRSATSSSDAWPSPPAVSKATKTSGRSPAKSSTSSARSSASSTWPQTSSTGRPVCRPTAAAAAATLLPHRPLASVAACCSADALRARSGPASMSVRTMSDGTAETVAGMGDGSVSAGAEAENAKPQSRKDGAKAGGRVGLGPPA